MCISTIGDSYRGFSMAPFFTGTELRKEIVDEENDSLAINAQSRFLFLAQIICSIVALPLTLLAAIVLPTIALCVEGKEAAWRELVWMGSMELFHLALIPTALIAAFAPHEKNWEEPAKSLDKIQWIETCLSEADQAYENAKNLRGQEREPSMDSNDDEREQHLARN